MALISKRLILILAAAFVVGGLAWGQTPGGGAPAAPAAPGAAPGAPGAPGAPAAPTAPGTPGTPAGPPAAPGQAGQPPAGLPATPGTALPAPTVYEEPALPISTQADDYRQLPRFGAELFAAAAQVGLAGLLPTQVVPNVPLGTATGQGGAAPGATGMTTGLPPATTGQPAPAPATATGAYPTAPGMPATTTGGPAPGLSAGAASGVALTTPSGTTVVAQPGVAPLYPSGMMIPTPPGMTPPWAPVVNAPVPPNYVLGPGDSLTLTVLAAGNTQINDTYTVTAEGFLFLPQLGRVAAAGERLEHLQAAVAQAYRQYYNNPVVTLVISQQRVVEVYVMGEVVRPGKYALTGMATVLTALYAAGGPSDIGTYRNIQLTRVGRPSVTIDLYDYLLYGKRDQDVMLEPGDSLFLPPLQSEVGVAGDVRRPARYELKGVTTVAQALAMAGGMAATGYAPGVQLWRLDPTRQWQLTLLNLSRPGAPDLARPLRDGDLLVVPTALPEANNLVYLTGAVRRPGAYPATPGATVGGLIAAAEGLDPTAHVGLGILRRLKPDLDYETISFNVEDVVTGKPGADLPVRPNDVVQIFTKEQVEPPLQVEVRGAVVRPGLYPYALDMRLSQLVTEAGGPVPGAYLDRAEILRLRPDQRRDVVPVDLLAALAGRRSADVTLARGDILQVQLRSELLPVSQVRIEGFVANPGVYPRVQDMKVSDLIYAAGGLLPGAGPTVQFVRGRYVGQPQPVTLHLTGDASHFQLAPDPVLRDDDTVGVGGQGDFTAQPEMVSIAGEVEHPGAIALPRAAGTEAFTAWDLLQQGGKLLPDACLDGLIVYRRAQASTTLGQAEDLSKVLQAVNGEALQEQAATAATNAAQATANGAAQAAALTQNVTQGLATVLSGNGVISIVLPPTAVSTEQAVSGIPLDGETLVQSKGARGNLTLQDGDYLYVPKQPATVTVLGAVARSGAVPVLGATRTRDRRRYHAPTALDYVAVSGGFREDAATDHLIVVHLNGSVTPAQLKTPLRPGDVLVVPSRYVVRNVRTQSELDSWLKAIVPLVTTALVVKM